jgi:poly(3-hydroxyalkanoate) depolymerase
VVRFDVPGVGGSQLPPFPYPIAALSSWVSALMTRLGHERFDVLGLSWGGGLAQQLAVQARRRVRRLVLVATGTGALMVPARPHVLAKMLTPRRHRDPEYAASVASEIYGGTMRTDPRRGADLLHGATRSGPKRGYYYQLAAMTGWSSLPFLGLIKQPTLVMGGDDDPIIPVANPRMQAQLIPSSTLHVYRGGHLAILTEADELAPVIEEFLDPQPADAPPPSQETT